jgi:hypothetical protein
VTSDLDLPGIAHSGGLRPAVHIRVADTDEVRSRFGGTSAANWETILGDGVAVRYDLGGRGEHRILYGDSEFHIDARGTTVLCAPARGDTAGWQRQLLDTVLFTVSFARGFELLHGGAVVVPGGAVAFVGPAGAGKSSLVSELMRRGHRLLSDDVIAIDESGESVTAFPGPAVMNLPLAAADDDTLGTSVIARFEREEELWVVVAGAADQPAPLTAIFILDRAGTHTAVEPMQRASFLDLAPYAISLPHGRERAQRRFDLLSTLATRVPVSRLVRGPNGSPAVLADHVQRWLERAGVGGGSGGEIP